MNSLVHRISGHYRRRRLRFLSDLVRGFPRPLTLLDVGGTEAYWRPLDLREGDVHVILLNRKHLAVENPRVFTSILGDARDLGAWSDHSVDFIHSNSVIEHLFGWEEQVTMAREVRRAAKAYYVQTPNRHFPIEPHWLVPGFQYLPREVRIALTRRLSLGHMPRLPDHERAARLVDEVRLLTRREVRELFPDAKVHEESVLGLTKSFCAYRI
jgi:hypothetical protein